MTKKHKRRLEPETFKSAPGAFADALHAADKLTRKFRFSNLDKALCKAIEDGRLFVMPKGESFSIRRSVSLDKVRLGGHEVQNKDGSIDFDSPRVLTAYYEIKTCGEDKDGEDIDKSVIIDITIPSRFIRVYVERGNRFLPFTNLEFVYSEKDLRTWMMELQMKIYADAEFECHSKIREYRERIKLIQDTKLGKKKRA